MSRQFSGLRSDAQGGAFLENGLSPGGRSLKVAALLGVAVCRIGAATVRERLPQDAGTCSSFVETPPGVMDNRCH